ncbi:MAG: hypothetical protein QXP53_02270 [Candidatus Pacearchaeota archaeon]
MRKKIVENPLEFDFDELERFNKCLENLEGIGVKEMAREGVCDECGALSVVTKKRGRTLCCACSNNLKQNFKNK